MTPRSLLANALATLYNPRRWTQGTSAKTLGGRLCGVSNPDAASWDVYGAIYRQDPPGFVASAAVELLDNLCGGDLFRWNDDPERQHGEVVELLTRAVATYDVEDPVFPEEMTRPDAIRSVDIARAYEHAWRGQP